MSSFALFIPALIDCKFTPRFIYFKPSDISSCAKITEVEVPSPTTSFVLFATSFIIETPIFSYLSFSVMSFTIVTPSFVTSGLPYVLSRTMFLPNGPIVTLTADEAISTPFLILFLAFSENNTSFAILILLI